MKNEMDLMKLEMVKEIRDMKNGVTSGLQDMQQSITQMNSYLKQNLDRLNRDGSHAEPSSEQPLLASDISKCPYSG